MDFVDDRAEEASDDEESGSEEEYGDHVSSKKPKKTSTKKRIFDSSDEDEDEDDPEALAEEMKDLINDDEEEEEDKESDDEAVSKKRKHTEGDDEDDSDGELDEDDLNLLEENLGVKLERKKKNLKRLRRLDEDDSDKEDEPEKARETIANELFDGDDEAPTQKIPSRREEDDKYGDISGSEESDEDNFIVDDDDQPISRPRKKKGVRHNDEQLQQAQELFGVEFDYEDAEGFNDDYYDEEQEEGYEDEEGVEGGIQRKPRGKKARKSIFEIYEPTELEKSHLTDADKEIREADVPERFLLRGIPVKETRDEREIEDEAEWIYTHAFNKNTLTKQTPGNDGLAPLYGSKDPSVILMIREALKFMRINFLEVPFIATYKKEYMQPSQGTKGLQTDNLWAIYRHDEKFLHLRLRIDNMVKLFTNMKIYQEDRLLEGNTTGSLNLIDDLTIRQVAEVTTFEELHDRWLYFQLFYSRDVPEMKREVEKKEKMKRKQEKERKRQAMLENLAEGEELPPEDEDDEDDDETINKRFSTLKLAQRKDIYTSCRESGIKGLVEQYGLTAEQLAENIRDNYTKHEVEQASRPPLDIAADFVCTRFPTPDLALKAARYMIAKEISCNPLIRKCIRTIFIERAVVNVRPTEKGLKAGMDETHPCYTQKYLKEKNIGSFVDDQFLNLLQAEQDGLLNVSVTIDACKKGCDKVEPYINDLIILFKKDEFSDSVEQWNAERLEALKLALYKMIYPSIEKEMKNKMKEEAIAAIALKCGKNLAQLLNVAPYVPPNTVTDDEDFYINEGVRILGFAFSNDHEESCFAALIDGDGEVIEYIRLPHFMMRTRPGMDHLPGSNSFLKDKDIQKLKSFIVSRKPHVIALGAEGMETRRVYTDLDELLNSLTESDQLPKINVEIVDNELARVYQSSRRANTDFKEYPLLLRQAISLARRLQDPLIEFAQLCSPDEEILCLKFHQHQNFVPKDLLLETINMEFINAVNRVGVDVNRAVTHPHTNSLVQFIAGFGPRKAATFLRTLKKLPAQCLESRTQLIMNCKFGAKVFINCAGFIKIDTTQLSDSTTDTYIEVLDSTRVHPEAYEWARKMAVDALEYDDETDINPAGALEEILENPNRLEDLDLDAFAEELEKQGYGNKTLTLYDIRAELSSRFKDPREPYKTPENTALFKILTRETSETLHVGKLVQGTVFRIARKPPTQDQMTTGEPLRADDTSQKWMCPFCLNKDFDELNDVWSHFDSGTCPGPAFGVNVRLDNGIIGFVRIENLSDNPVEKPEDRVRPGMVINARILDINAEKFSVLLTCQSSHLNDNGFQFRPPMDPDYDHEKEEEDNKAKEDKQKKMIKKTYVKRIITHPQFKNVDYKKAEQILGRMSQGDCIVRPSSKGSDHLTLTWKVNPAILAHVDIIEKNKDNPFGLGKQLIIDKETYEDLDEIIARYVTPMAQFARELINFRYFRNAEGGKKELMEGYLNAARQEQPNKIHYFVAASRERPGKFILSYLPRTKCIHEYITVTPEGYRYRQRIFSSVNQLFKWFKEHFRDPPPQPSPAAMMISTPGMGTPGGIILSDRAGSVQAMRTPTQTPLANFGGHVRPPGNYYPSPMAAPRTPAQQTPGGSFIKPGVPMPPPGIPGRPTSRAGAQWGQMASGYDQKPRITPRTPNYATPGSSSVNMDISPAPSFGARIGDQTPLEDEAWN